MPRKLLNDISASTTQVLLNQLLGLVIFYITSRFITKELFGELNWSLATSSLLISILGLGIDLIIVRKIAAGENVRETAGLYLTHVLASGITVVVLVLLGYLFIPAFYSAHILLPGIMISQLLSFFASPYKQISNGQRAFRQLAFISTISNSIKAVLLTICLLANTLTPRIIIFVFILGALAEFLSGLLLITKKNVNLFPLYHNAKKYLSLVKESLPQFGVTVFNVVLARFDWFLLGILTTTTITAEYSFAYKVFELSRVPLLALSPVLIPLFVKIFNQATIPSRTLLKLRLLFRAEMIVSVLFPLLLASCWTPLMDSITHHKYGAANEYVFLVLALCVPLQFATDYYWNMCFAQNQLRLTFLISVCSCTVNILLNIFLIPVYGAAGAAFAYIACFIIQLILFKLYTRQDKVKPDLLLLAKTMLCSIAALLIVRQYIHNPLIAVLAVFFLYPVFSIITQLVIVKKIKAAVKLLVMK